MESNLDGRGIRLTIAEFCDTVSKNKEGMDYLVLTTKDLVTTAVPYFEKIKASTSSEELNNIMQKFQIVIDPEKDELYKFLAGRYHSETYNGFIFFRLGK